MQNVYRNLIVNKEIYWAIFYEDDEEIGNKI